MNFKLTIEAQKDLTNIWYYTFKNWSKAQADRYLNLIFSEMEYLCDKPFSGKDFSHIRKGYYRSKVKSHFLFYKIDNTENCIEIIRVLHQRMDIVGRL